MEEQQIRDFVDRTTGDAAFRQQVMSNPEAVVRQEGYSDSVARVITRLVPHLALERSSSTVSFSWWW